MPYKNRKDRRAAEKRYRTRNKDAVRARLDAYDAAHPEMRRDIAARWRAKNPGYYRARKLKTRYGLTEAAFESLLDGQDRACAVCRCNLDAKGVVPCVDHDHNTGDVRGVLCRACNTGLGLFKDDPELMRAAAAYVERSR